MLTSLISHSKTTFSGGLRFVREGGESLVACDQFSPEENRRRRIFNEIMLVFLVLGLYAAGDASRWNYGHQSWPELQRNTVWGGLTLAWVCAGLWALNRRGRVPIAGLGYGFTLVLATLIGVITDPKVLNNSSALFFFSIPIAFASMLIRPSAAFILALYCAGLLHVLPGVQVGWAFVDENINTLAEIGFLAMALFAWRSVSLLETALREQQTLNGHLLALMESNQKLTEKDRQKTKFVSDVSHELRSPMNALNLYLRTISKNPARLDVAQIMTMQGEVDRLTTLIREVLDLSRLETMATHPESFVSVQLEQVVQQVVAQLRLTAEQKPLTLEGQYQPAQVRGNPAQLKQVFLNLLANAISYTPAGGSVCVTLNVNGQAQVHIQDTGRGIAPDDLPHLFTRFYRGSLTDSVPGTGLGLAIVHEITSLHGGQVTVTSTPGKGSTFTVTLPLLE